MTDWKQANIYEKLFDVQGRVGHLSKTEKNPQQGFNYVKASTATDAIRGAFNDVGIVITFDQTESNVQSYATAGGKLWWFTELQAIITFINIHKPEEKVSIRVCGQGTDSGEKGIGKALSYAFKYGMFKQFLISTDEDDPERPSEDRDDRNQPPRTRRPPEAPQQPQQAKNGAKQSYTFPCPWCDGTVREVNGKNGPFWGCSKWHSGCKFSCQPEEVSQYLSGGKAPAPSRSTPDDDLAEYGL